MAPTGRAGRVCSSIPRPLEAPRAASPHSTLDRAGPGQPPVSPDPIVYLHSVFPAGERAAGGGGRSRAPENTSAPWDTMGSRAPSLPGGHRSDGRAGAGTDFRLPLLHWQLVCEGR